MESEASKIYLCASEQKLEEFKSFVSDLKKHFDVRNIDDCSSTDDVSDIILLGGDGSLNYLVNKVSRLSQLRVLYFPVGTANDFAKSLKIIPTGPTIEKTLSIFKNSPLISIPVMQCNERRFINVATGGAPAKVTTSGTDLIKELTGKISYYVSALGEMMSPSEVIIDYKINKSESRSISAFGFIVSQGLYAGGGFKVSTNFTPNFKENFNFVTVESKNLSSSLATILRLQQSEELDIEESLLVSEFTDNLIIKSEKEIFIKLDGEEYSANKLKFTKNSEKLMFYQF